MDGFLQQQANGRAILSPLPVCDAGIMFFGETHLGKEGPEMTGVWKCPKCGHENAPRAMFSAARLRRAVPDVPGGNGPNPPISPFAKGD
jgi:hypothetical protein